MERIFAADKPLPRYCTRALTVLFFNWRTPPPRLAELPNRASGRRKPECCTVCDALATSAQKVRRKPTVDCCETIGELTTPGG